MGLHESGENYLEAILLLDRRGKPVRSVDVARLLGYSKPSVSRAMKQLKEQGYIQMEAYGSIELTEAGRDMAGSVLERHRFISDYLMLFLGLSAEVADTDACRIEHIISPETFSEMKLRVSKAKEGASNAD